MSNMIEWKWSSGEKYQQSNKLQKEEFMKKINETIDLSQIKTNDLALSMNTSMNTPEGFIHKQNKLDGQNEKLSSRHMIVQKGINPFVNTSNYIDHLDMETSFLRPKDSNFDEKQ